MGRTTRAPHREDDHERRDGQAPDEVGGALMPGQSELALFALGSLVLLALPGPSMLFVISRTLELGRTAGLVTVLGIAAGCLVQVGAAAAGVSAVLASSEGAMSALRLAGAAYLVYLGLGRLRRG